MLTFHSRQSSENPQTTASPFPRSAATSPRAPSSGSKSASPDPRVRIAEGNAHKSLPTLNRNRQSHVIQHDSIVLRKEFHRIVEAALAKRSRCFEILRFIGPKNGNSALNVVIAASLTRQIEQITVRGIQFLPFTAVLFAH